MIIRASFWLSYQDSNLDKQNQKLLCYHYTIGQTYALSVKKRCKDRHGIVLSGLRLPKMTTRMMPITVAV